MSKRTNRILELLTDKGQLEVSLLADLLDVSKVTIRKDLNELEQKGIIVREHGLAVLRSRDDINGRMAYHYEEKKKIAAEAAKLVNDGDTIIIESGSCCALLAETLTSTKKDLTIITNSSFIIDFIRGRSDFQIVLLGGIYQQDAQVMVGPMVRQCVQNFCVDLLFIGADGYSPRHGFMNQDQMRAQTASDMSAQTERVVVLTESDKFNKHGVVPLNLQNDHICVITDSSLSSVCERVLLSNGIDVIKTGTYGEKL